MITVQEIRGELQYFGPSLPTLFSELMWALMDMGEVRSGPLIYFNFVYFVDLSLEIDDL